MPGAVVHFPYELAPDNRTLTIALGCTRFRTDLMERYSQALESVAPVFRHCNDGLDGWLVVDLQTRGHRPHLHSPKGCSPPHDFSRSGHR